MDQDIEETVEKIHSTQTKIVLYATGGAAQVKLFLLSHRRASTTSPPTLKPTAFT